jgi:hypothetical protein
MDVVSTHETIVTSMGAVTAELPLSPELVLVSPPEVASLARQLLGDPEPAMRSTAAATRASSSRLPGVVFSVFCAANCLVPFAFAVLVAG